MKVLTCVTLLILVLSTVSHRHYNCVFDQINQDLHQLSSKAKPDVGLPPSTSARNLLTITRNPIRITLDPSAFNTVGTPSNGAAATTKTNLAFMLRALQVATYFYMNRIKVYPITTILAPGSCVNYATPNNDQIYGIAGSDLHIYMRQITDPNTAYGASGKSCKYYGDQLSVPPDNTLQIGRPTMGNIIFNSYQLTDGLSLTNRLFVSITSTCLHEVMHILGMDSTLYSYWLDSNPSSATYGNFYTSTTLPGTGKTHSARGNATKFLTTPYVSAWAQNYFNCPAAQLPGMLLQNQDATGVASGSHWQRLAVYDELMTATSLGAFKGFSGLTFAALKDMGWYTVDDTFNETSNYGYQKGCSFVLDGCYSSTSFPEFCNAATQSSISSCQTTFFGKAICSNQASLMADGCGLYGPYFNCVDPASQNEGYQSYTFQVYGTNSFCIGSTLGTVALPSTLQSRCYPYVCGTSSITFIIGTYTIVCQNTQNGVQKTLSAFTGYLQCPIFADFCTNSRKTCPNWCSQNGYCMRGICNCYQGYQGDDCSQTQCSTGSFYNPLSNTCTSTCPSGYYSNSYSLTCNMCQSPCQQCYQQPTICTGCISSVSSPQYFYNNTCYSTCPFGTFTSGFSCLLCSSAANCASCSGTSTNCTSCSGGLYLNQPVSGSCIASCPISGTYTVADVVDFVCVSTCANNLILINNTCTYCQGGTFKLISNTSCVSSCPNFYYADSAKHLCSQCDSSCLTCSAAYAENCTSCSPTATLRYFLLQMCWSVCPGGYYANDTDSSCHICPLDLYCSNCTYSTSVLCTSCIYGYFFQSSSSSCLSSCNTTQYANKGNNMCVNCDSSCLSCAGPGPTFCTSCSGSLFFISNITGGYCISGCSSIGYTQSGTSCLACDLTCYTCSGTASNQCTSCLNGTYFAAGYCRFVCPAATYPNTQSLVCSPCSGNCTYCFEATNDNCTGCVSGMVLYNFTCMSSCPSGYTTNQWNVCFQSYLRTIFAFVLVVTLLLL